MRTITWRQWVLGGACVGLSLVAVELGLQLCNFEVGSFLFQDSIKTDVLRRFFIVDKNTVMRLTDKPNNLVIFGVTSQDPEWSVDTFGFRPDYRVNDQPAQFRVLVVGDSYTYSDGATHVEAYPAQLEYDLISRGIDVNVINAGVPGYGPDQVYNQLQELIPRWQPDLVLWNLYQNDLTDANYYCLYRLNSQQALQSVPIWQNNVFRQGVLVDIIPYQFFRWKLWQLLLAVVGYPYGGDGYVPIATWGCTQPYNNQVELEMAQKTLLMVEAARQLQAVHGGELMAVVLPFQRAYEPLGNATEESTRLQLLQSIPTNLRLKVCDVKQAFDAFNESGQHQRLVNTWFQDASEDSSPHRHLNPKGYQMAAQVVSHCLLTQPEVWK